MTRAPTRSGALVAAAIAALLLGACALDDGRPWGVLELELTASFEVPASRLVDGRLKTANNYLIQIDALTLEVDAVTVTQRAGGGGAQVFDPAKPPPGYSLCHNGHCHRDDGALIDYDEIILELAGGRDAIGPSVTIPALDAAVGVALGARADVPLGPCPDGCTFDRGALSTLRVAVGAIEVSGVAFDELTGDAARLDPAGRPFTVTLAPPSSDPTAALSAAFGKDEPFGLRVATTLALPAGWFDGIDWADLPEGDLASTLDHAFGERAALRVTMSHFAND